MSRGIRSTSCHHQHDALVRKKTAVLGRYLRCNASAIAVIKRGSVPKLATVLIAAAGCIRRVVAAADDRHLSLPGSCGLCRGVGATYTFRSVCLSR